MGSPDVLHPTLFGRWHWVGVRSTVDSRVRQCSGSRVGFRWHYARISVDPLRPTETLGEFCYTKIKVGRCTSLAFRIG